MKEYNTENTYVTPQHIQGLYNSKIPIWKFTPHKQPLYSSQDKESILESFIQHVLVKLMLLQKNIPYDPCYLNVPPQTSCDMISTIINYYSEIYLINDKTDNSIHRASVRNNSLKQYIQDHNNSRIIDDALSKTNALRRIIEKIPILRVKLEHDTIRRFLLNPNILLDSFDIFPPHVIPHLFSLNIYLDLLNNTKHAKHRINLIDEQEHLRIRSLVNYCNRIHNTAQNNTGNIQEVFNNLIIIRCAKDIVLHFKDMVLLSQQDLFLNADRFNMYNKNINRAVQQSNEKVRTFLRIRTNHDLNIVNTSIYIKRVCKIINSLYNIQHENNVQLQRIIQKYSSVNID
ncbi:MAG: hypothetical protein P857_130 [Candidatus Xenolissoclinum pacificiensis L6]|uniref:Uncharacterized protein n=1 Tax=Candidatus Xenolissoclinum pacificiensis L6 TaxID=1401685 RepID=W2UYV1_9RICK|nr:MAG: hypothetical protein P857_130 [Candidatus Xenolissoclinum pacificiensis L6]